MSRDAAYPIFLNLSRHPVLIVGGGGVALRKAKGLLEAGARVTVVSPEFAEELATLRVTRIRKGYVPAHMRLKPWRLVFAATNVSAVNRQVRKDATAAGVLCSRADEPDDSDFAGGAHRRVGTGKVAGSEIVIAVSTSGASPVLGARICREITESVDPVLIGLGELFARCREEAKRGCTDAGARRALLQRMAGEEMEGIFRKKGMEGAWAAFKTWLSEANGLPAGASANGALRPKRGSR